MRGVPMADKYWLGVIKSNREWRLTMTGGVRDKPIKLRERRFTCWADAEW